MDGDTGGAGLITDEDAESDPGFFQLTATRCPACQRAGCFSHSRQRLTPSPRLPFVREVHALFQAKPWKPVVPLDIATDLFMKDHTLGRDISRTILIFWRCRSYH